MKKVKTSSNQNTKKNSTPFFNKNGIFNNTQQPFFQSSNNSTNIIQKKPKDDKKDISDKYGGAKVYEWSGYANDSREKKVVEIFEEVAKDNSHFTPSFLYTIAVGEGLGLWIDDNYDPNAPHEVMVENEVSGFDALGTDHFAGDISRLKKYLPADFNEGDEYDLSNETNEFGEAVQSADFKNLKSGIIGLVAVLSQRRDLVLKHAAELGYSSPSEDQEAYWIYVYYQGEGRGKSYMQTNRDLDYGKNPPKKMNEVKRLAMERLATWRYMQTKKLFTK